MPLAMVMVDLLESVQIEKLLPLKIKEILNNTQEKLRETSETPRLDAEILLGFALKVPRIKLISKYEEHISASELEIYLSYINRRLCSEPIHYITGSKEFYGLNFEVNPSVLIPRPETELLVELSIKEIEKKVSKGREEILFLDLGTGSGCISISVAIEVNRITKNIKFYAVDKSKDALATAKRNAQLNNASHINFIFGDWYTSFNKEKFDIIISNPPYIDQKNESVHPSVNFEPKSALYAEESGLLDIKKIISGAKDHLSPDGILAIEIGCTQSESAGSIAKINFPEAKEISFIKDLQGIDRILLIRS